MSAGKPTMVGASLSVTVMVKLPSVVSPAASVAVYVIVVAPTGNVAPLANPAVCAIVDPVQLSAEVGSTHVTSAPQTPASVFTAMFAGKLHRWSFVICYSNCKTSRKSIRASIGSCVSNCCAPTRECSAIG